MDVWHSKDRDYRVSVVAYNNAAHQLLTLKNYTTLGNSASKRLVYNYTTHDSHHTKLELHPNGDADVAKALDFVRENTLKEARPGVPKVVIPIIHQMKTGTSAHRQIVEAGQKLVDDCVSIIALTAAHPTLHMDTVRQMVNPS